MPPKLRLPCPIGRLLIALLLSVSLRAQLNYATPYAFSTIAGASNVGSTDGFGPFARFNYPQGVAVDATGNVYVADTMNFTIRKIAPAGVVTTLAGSPGLAGATDGTGSAARFAGVVGLGIDAAGNLYTASGYTVRKITPAGVVTTIAGSPDQSGFVDGPGATARFNSLSDLAVDAAGNVYVADSFNRTVRRIATDGTVTTLAPPGFFSRPQGIAVDANNNVYVSDQDYSVIRKITPTSGSTLAGSLGNSGSTDGTGASARFSFPSGLGVDSAGNVYVADASNQVIRKITPAGAVTTVAGRVQNVGSADGPGNSATFYNPQDVAADSAGNLYVADNYNHAIRKISPTAQVTTLAGIGRDSVAGSTDGIVSVARFRALDGIAIGPSKELYVADWANHTVRKITPEGVVSTLAGAAGVLGSSDGVGNSATFSTVEGVAVDSTGYVYATDTINHTIRKISPNGVVTTLAGLAGIPGTADGTGTNARFNRPYGIALDLSGNLIVGDYLNGAIRKVTPAGVVTTVAGLPGQPGAANGSAANARFAAPFAVAVDPSGNIFVGDNQCVRKITPDGNVTTFAGELLPPNTGSAAAVTDGPGNVARFGQIGGVATDRSGNVYVAGWSSGLVRKISPDGVVTTLAGQTYAGINRDGLGQSATFEQAQGIACDANGTLYITSTNVVHKGEVPFAPAITTQPQNLTTTQGGELVQMSVTATGVPAPTYQWYLNGTAIPGATVRALAWDRNVRPTDAGDYTVVVSNALGSVTSAKATLTVNAAPVVVTPPPASSGGGGAPSLWFVAALLTVTAWKVRNRS